MDFKYNIRKSRTLICMTTPKFRFSIRMSEEALDEKKIEAQLKDPIENGDDVFQEDVCEICGLVIDWRCQLEIEARKKGSAFGLLTFNFCKDCHCIRTLIQN